MVSNGYKEGDGSSLTCHVSLQISTSRKGLLNDNKSPRDFPNDVISPWGSKASSSSTFRQVMGDNPQGFRKRFTSVMHRKIEWPCVRKTCKEWIKKPLNIVLLLWVFCVGVSGAILFLVMTGMLDHSLPKKSQRDEWFEVNNQIINALFTLMCLYLHPKRFYHLVLLCRWNPKDIIQLRMIYCKNGSCKPNERAHMMVVVILLHINCFAQYALCGLNLGYKRSDRPIIGVAICLLVAILAPAIAGLYSMLSPLGKDYECDDDDVEKANQSVMKSSEKRFSLVPKEGLGSVESRPEWRGGIFDLWEDFSVAYLSILCCFCVFGWNMERLGFGNMYVHIATFTLFCMAPFLIFYLAAVNIDDDTIREILSITGIILCLFGLLYGGFWRIRIRKRFNLSPNNMCFGKPDVADCVQWLFCSWCSLAQEVRTGDVYDVVELGNEYNGHTPLTPLPREGNVGSYSRWANSGLLNPKSSVVIDEIMKPPTPSIMRTEDEDPRRNL